MLNKILDQFDVPGLDPVSGLDAAFLYGETPTSPMHIGSVAILEGSLKFETFKKALESKIHLLPNMRKRLMNVPFGVDYPYWVDDPNFNIELHIHHIALPRPGGWKQLRDLVSNIHSEPLDRTRPLWNYTFIEGLDEIPQVPKGSVAILSKIHHVAIDGMAGAGMMAILFNTKPNNDEPAPPKEYRPKPLPNDLSLIYKSALSFTKNPFKLPKILGSALTSSVKAGIATRVQRIKLPTAPFSAPRTPLNGIISAQRKWNTALLSLDRVKVLKNIMGTTLNDVILAICAGALRRYLLEKDKLPAKPLVAMIPISSRATEDKSNRGNQVSNMLVQLATNIENPLDRLEAIHENTIRGKIYNQALGAKTLSNLADTVPFGLANQASKLYSRYNIAKRHNPVFNVVITNVPGPNFPLYINKHKVLSVMGLAPIIDGMGLILTVFSYDGVISISPTSDSKSMPDIDAFTRYIWESANELEELVLAIKAKDKSTAKSGKPVSDAFFEKVRKHLKTEPTLIKADSGIYQVNITGPNSGTWSMNFNDQPGKLKRASSKDPDVTITIKDKHLVDIVNGKLNVTTAFVQGRIDMKGDSDKAMRFAKILTILQSAVKA